MVGYPCVTDYFLQVLRSICRRPEGMFWAGDTAQTISAGSSFRFNNLTSFMFEVEVGSITITLSAYHLAEVCWIVL